MPEKEYIEREAGINCCFAITTFIKCGISGSDARRILEAFNEIPAADVRPVVRAEWYGEAGGYADGELVYDMWSCPICGKRFEEWEEKPDWNFCPNCGADMREES